MNDRYSRQILFPPVGKRGQRALADSHVLIVGAGALGTASAEGLVRSGIGTLTIVDRDYVEFQIYSANSFTQNMMQRHMCQKQLRQKKTSQEINHEVTIDA
ncbi:ThiF family adenylyltransferase [Bacillus sp. SL00103]